MLIDKNSLPLVAMDFMNDVHLEDVEIINKLYHEALQYEKNETSFENVCNAFEFWIEHTINHFKGEEEKMQEASFPPYPIHKGEHDFELSQMRQAYSDWVEEKDIQGLKNYLETDMLEWLISHIKTMDTVTAMFLKTGLSPCSMH